MAGKHQTVISGRFGRFVTMSSHARTFNIRYFLRLYLGCASVCSTSVFIVYIAISLCFISLCRNVIIYLRRPVGSEIDSKIIHHVDIASGLYPILFCYPFSLERINHFHQTPDREWFKTEAVLRFSLGNFLFFTILSVVMIGVMSQKDPRDSIHYPPWWMDDESYLPVHTKRDY